MSLSTVIEESNLPTLADEQQSQPPKIIRKREIALELLNRQEFQVGMLVRVHHFESIYDFVDVPEDLYNLTFTAEKTRSDDFATFAFNVKYTTDN